jgi:N-acetylmuramoyl-L-alanine amidase
MNVLFIFLIACVAPAAPFHLLIDPGHGGKDKGATKADIYESEITLSVAKKLADILRSDSRFKVSLTRTTDDHLSLIQRSQLAKDKATDLFLSIHVNSSPDTKAKGAEFYFQNQLAPDEESMFLAHRENDLETGTAERDPHSYPFVEQAGYPPEVTAILTDLLDSNRLLNSSLLCKSLRTTWRGHGKGKSSSVRQAPFFVLSQITVPSALVELGYLTNPDDLQLLTDPKAQARMAEDLYLGLLQYRESITQRHASRQP